MMSHALTRPRALGASYRLLLRGYSTASTETPVVTASAIAQAFSSQTTPSLAAQSKPKKAPTRKKVASSVPAGTLLQGLGYMKGRPDPEALPDREYPDWLWGVLDTINQDKAGDEANAMFGKSKKQRREAAKKARKDALLHPESLMPQLPIHHQSIDLPSNQEKTVEGARLAMETRDSITKELRKQRRKDIKEDNYLRTMR